MSFQEEIEGRPASIVDLAEHRPAAPVSKLAAIERHWNDVRRGRIVPTRSDLDPRMMSASLEHAFILERLATGLARFRLAGSHINELIGLEVRGMPLSSIFTPDARKILSDSLQSVFDEPATARFVIESPSQFGRPAMNGEMVLLPLRSDLGDVTRVLGGLVLHGEIGRSPRRLSITGQTRQTLTGYARPERPAAAPAESPRPAAQTAPVVHGHLRLVVDNA